MEYTNVFYFYNINCIGGVESFFYYLAKKYGEYDITIFYKIGDFKQIERLKKYVRVKKYNDEFIKCKKVFLNYNSEGFIENVEADEYIQIIHTDYKARKLQPSLNPIINRYIGVSQVVCDAFTELTGIDCELCYNPIVLDKPKKLLKLISATRLTSEKGKEEIIKFGNILNKKGIPYMWLIFTNDKDKIDNPNIIYMNPRLDITNYMGESDFLVQLSKEAFGYSIVENLCIGKPVIVLNLPIFKELGLNNDNSIKLDENFEDIDEKKLFKKYDFVYKVPNDNWKNLLIKSKSNYQKDIKKMVKIKCIRNYNDILLGKYISTLDNPYEVSKARADELLEKGYVELV